MANWEKLNKEFDDALDSMTKEDWDNWYKNVVQKRINQNKMEEETKDLNYWKLNAEEDYIKTPISVLRYISELEQIIENKEIQEQLRIAEQLENEIDNL